MTNADMRADAVISPALQNVLLMLSASEAQGLPAGADLLQHLVPSQKHLTMLHRHVQVCNYSNKRLWMTHGLFTICITWNIIWRCVVFLQGFKCMRADGMYVRCSIAHNSQKPA